MADRHYGQVLVLYLSPSVPSDCKLFRVEAHYLFVAELSLCSAMYVYGARSYRHVSFPDDDAEEIVRINPREKIWMTGYEDYHHAPSRGKYIDTDDVDLYIRFAKSDASKHNYNYPYIDSSDFDLGEDIKGDVIKTQPVKFKPRWKEDGKRSRCVYCRDIFNHEENRRGQSQDAPDHVRSCIRRFSCMWCADSIFIYCPHTT
nr:sprouty-related, EVH1 domain-containing protein 2-like [Chrysemys picta bellii]